MNQKPLPLQKIRDLNLEAPTSPGRPSHIAAASGLVFVDNHFYVIPDDEHFLGVFNDLTSPGTLVRVFPGDLPDDHHHRKKIKPDLEVLLAFQGSLIALPSGSKPHRTKGALMALHREIAGAVQNIQDLDLAPLYQELDKQFSRELNIEGAVFSEKSLKLFQRGNGKSHINAVIGLDLESVKEALKFQRPFLPDFILNIDRYDLGDLNGVPLSFTDATAFEGGILFSAAAEASPDTYEDGKCEGSVMGQIDSQGQVVTLCPLSHGIKVEGIATQKTQHELKLYLVTDGDDPRQPAELFQATWDR